MMERINLTKELLRLERAIARAEAKLEELKAQRAEVLSQLR